MTAFHSMPESDQIHHSCVARRLLDDGLTDPDLIQAALLHDIGKFEDGRGPNIADRTLMVLIGSVAPRTLGRMTARRHWWNRGLFLAAHHAEIGCEMASQLGCSERTQQLIGNHGYRSSTGDALLQALQRADSAC